MGFMDILTGKDSDKDFEHKLLSGKTIAFVATDGFEQSELFDPKSILEDAGAVVKIISIKSGSIKAWNKDDWGKKIDVDVTIEMADAAYFDGLVLPGGVINPDKLRQNAMVIEFVRRFVEAGKPIGAICHGPQTLIEVDAAIRGTRADAAGKNGSFFGDQDDADVFLKGRTLTSYPSLKTDLMNAGAHWVDEEVVADGFLVTSRKPSDIPAFMAKLIEVFAKDPQAMAYRYEGARESYGESPLRDSYLADTRVNDEASDKLNSAGPESALSGPSLRRPQPTYPQTPDSRL